tara:strand:- start:6523 stop:7422 length:900 start_codon:yes stop_codon:yes gene_type:complete
MTKNTDLLKAAQTATDSLTAAASLREPRSAEQVQRDLSGQEIYGDNFTIDEIQKWYSEEEHGYHDLAVKAGGHESIYAAFDKYHFFDRIKVSGKFFAVGVADGSDFLPISSSIDEFHFVEICEDFWTDTIGQTPAFYSKPSVLGTLEYPDNMFDHGAFFSVLHHIPNVSCSLREMYRVLKPGGVLFLREPTVSMGDWRHPRSGLTNNERGIPLPALRNLATDLGFQILREVECIHPLVRHLAKACGLSRPFSNSTLTKIDVGVSKLVRFSTAYHPQNLIQKMRPQGVAMILVKSKLAFS